MAIILPFPDRSAIMVDRAGNGLWSVEPFLCPRAAGRDRTFDHAGDTIDYAEALAIEAGTGFCIMCDL